MLSTYPHERTALFVDAGNTDHTMKLLGWQLDYERLSRHVATECRFVRPYYYSTFEGEDERENDRSRKFFDWLRYHGYEVTTMQVRTVLRYSAIQVQMAVDMLVLAPALHHLMIFSGNSDFLPVVIALQRMGKRVTIVSTLRDRVTSDDLRKQADAFIELNDLRMVASRDEMEGRTIPPPFDPARGR